MTDWSKKAIARYPSCITMFYGDGSRLRRSIEEDCTKLAFSRASKTLDAFKRLRASGPPPMPIFFTAVRSETNASV